MIADSLRDAARAISQIQDRHLGHVQLAFNPNVMYSTTRILECGQWLLQYVALNPSVQGITTGLKRLTQCGVDKTDLTVFCLYCEVRAAKDTKLLGYIEDTALHEELSARIEAAKACSRLFAAIRETWENP